jgi:hypothetical protein
MGAAQRGADPSARPAAAAATTTWCGRRPAAAVHAPARVVTAATDARDHRVSLVRRLAASAMGQT